MRARRTLLTSVTMTVNSGDSLSLAAGCVQEMSAGPFKPDTGNAAAVLARSGAVERLWESPDERTYRLAVHVSLAARQGGESCSIRLSQTRSLCGWYPILDHPL